MTTPPPAPSAPSEGSTKPHEPVRLPRSKRTGETCGNCERSGRPCRHHGGKSTGPRTAEGKKRVRQNGVKHGLRSQPARYGDDLQGERRARFEELVTTIARAEGVLEDPLRLAIVRDFVLADMMLEGGREWIFRHGALTVERWRTLGTSEGVEVRDKDVDGRDIREPVVNAAFVHYVDRLTKLKARLHDALRGRGSSPRLPEGGAPGGDVVERLRAAMDELDEGGGDGAE